MMGKGTFFVALAAIALVLPGVDATDYTCGPFTAKDTKCVHTLKKGEKFTLDCTGATGSVIPSDLLAGTAASAKVCSDSKARSAVAGACTKEIALDTLAAKKVAVTASKTGLTLTNTEYKEKSEMIITGSCADKAQAATKSGYFSVTFNASNGAFNTRASLAAATGIALLGMAAL